MRVRDLLLSVVLGVVLISVACVWFYPSVEDFMAANTMWNGVKSFVGWSRAAYVESLGSLPAPPDGAVLVTIPYQRYTTMDIGRLKDFVSGGGTLLLMDDFGYGNSILAGLGLSERFSGQLLLDPLFCYKNAGMPRITDFSPQMASSGIKSIVLNRGTALVNVAPAEALAWSSDRSFLDINGNGVKDGNQAGGPFPVAALISYGKGKVVLLSDPGIIINSMAGQDDDRQFVSYLIATYGNGQEVMFDSTHLSKKPLDVSKTRLTAARAVLGSPPALVGVVAVVFVAVSSYTLRKGEAVGPKKRDI